MSTLETFLQGTIRTATPLAFAALGETIVERAGIINVGVELLPGGYSEAISLKKIENIRGNLRQVFEIARTDGITTHEAALRLAKARIAEGKKAKKA